MQVSQLGPLQKRVLLPIIVVFDILAPHQKCVYVQMQIV